MKKLIIFWCLALFLYSQSIEIVSNNKKYALDLSKIPKKYWIKIYKKAPFDFKKHLYTGITLKTFVNLISPNVKSVTFIAYDEYKVTFDKNQINKPYILFIFLQDNKPIPISKRGPAKIIYTKKDNNKDYIFKSIFLIKKAVIEK